MERVQFKDIAIGKEFLFDTQMYVKIPPEKVTCCKSYNASLKDTPAKKIIVHSQTYVEVETNDKL